MYKYYDPVKKNTSSFLFSFRFASLPQKQLGGWHRPSLNYRLTFGSLRLFPGCLQPPDSPCFLERRPCAPDLACCLLSWDAGFQLCVIHSCASCLCWRLGFEFPRGNPSRMEGFYSVEGFQHRLGTRAAFSPKLELRTSGQISSSSCQGRRWFPIITTQVALRPTP